LQEFRRSFLGFPDGTIDDKDIFNPLRALQHLKPCNTYNGEAGIGTGIGTGEQKSGAGKMDSDGREIDDRELDGRLMDGQESTATAKSPGKIYSPRVLCLIEVFGQFQYVLVCCMGGE
jgi:hypothetical protein